MSMIRTFYEGHDPAKDAEADSIVATFGGERTGSGFHFESGMRDLEWELPRDKAVKAARALTDAGFGVSVYFTTPNSS
jgi:hypothetical protein